MKKLLILIIFLISFCFAQPIHHRINDYGQNEGYTDSYTKWHLAAGLLKGAISDEIITPIAVHYGYYNPSVWVKLAVNLGLAVTWEVGELIIEKNWHEYEHPWKNNGFDVFIDEVAFSMFLWTEAYLEFRGDGNDFEINLWVTI